MTKDEKKVTINKGNQALSISNAKAYEKPSKVSQRVLEYPEKGKKKVLRSRTYPNGVIKNDVVGMYKGKDMMFNKGMDLEKV